MPDPTQPNLDPNFDYEAIAKRLGEENLKQRLTKQTNPVAHQAYQGTTRFSWEQRINMEFLVPWTFKKLGLYKRGYNNFLNIRVVENKVRLANLPDAFHGFRILQMADLHCDLDNKFRGAVIKSIRDLVYDICINTGDFRNRTYDCHLASMAGTREIYQHIHKPCYGVLGNHDFIEKADTLEEMGIRLLLNESVPLEQDGQKLWLAGVDDPHLYRSDDLPRAMQRVPENACVLLLAHSPEIYKEAAAAGISYMFSGHTHGGQICLPGGFIVARHVKIPRKYCRGPWRYKTLKAYTSLGTGASTAPIRFNCPPEVVIHTLLKG